MFGMSAANTRSVRFGAKRRLGPAVAAASAAALAIGLAAGGVSARLHAQTGHAMTLNQVAEGYVRLVLALGQHDADYVDAYYGPPEWRTQAAAQKRTLAQIGAEADRLTAAVSKPAPAGRDSELVSLRHVFLRRQLQALASRVQMLSGTKLAFDDESRALYDAVAPTRPESEFQSVLDQLDRRLPGRGPLLARFDAFQKAFVIPPDRLAKVVDAAIAECRARTKAHVQLPAGENFKVEYVAKKSWGAYNWYQGNYQSLIQVNTDLPVFIDRAIDMACHEGYPGHHVYNAMLEQQLVRDRGWVEMSVYALFSPQSLIAEGSANFGIDMAFPGDERLAFERDVLFPLAGLAPSRAAEYREVIRLKERLRYADNEAARRYLDGRADREATAAWLGRFALEPEDRAMRATRFYDQYRSYVINYNLGMDLVRHYVESRATGASAAKRWEEFLRLLGSPRLPSGLR
jgi:hypothetical protein